VSPRRTANRAEPWAPTALHHCDLDQPMADVPASRPGGAVIVFWSGPVPLGQVELPASELPCDGHRLRALAISAIAPAVAAHLSGSTFRPQAPGAPDPRAPEPPAELDDLLGPDPLRRLRAHLDARVGVDPGAVSVVVCTRDRPDRLARCLDALLASHHRPLELLVVDNAPTSDATARVVADRPEVRYVVELRPGLSIARNRGIAETSGTVVAFTDDDAEVHPDWLWRLAQGFDRPDVGVVTGLVLPAELDEEGQVLFERGVGGFGQGFQSTRFDRDWLYDEGKVWRMGAGASMAIRRSAFAQVGAFDERLGAGAAGCSEDSELWSRVLEHGSTGHYLPEAVVFHHHRSTVDDVRRLSRDYLRGHVAALAVQVRDYRRPPDVRRLAIGLPQHYAGRALRTARGADRKPTLAPEVAGWLAGLRLAPTLLRSRRGWGPAPSQPFLSDNPYGQPWTEGLFYREKMRAIHRVAPPTATQVLEIGGGRSNLTSRLFPDAHVVNLELEQDHAGDAGLATSFVAGDATRLPFADEAFDVVTLFDVLEHIPDDAGAASEAVRVLRPGGSLLLSSPNEQWRFPYHRAYRSACPRDVDVMAEWGHVRRNYDTQTLEALVGWPVSSWATFISPITVVAHDIGFSNLSKRTRRVLGAAVAPITWTGYALHRRHATGTETAWAWRKAG